MAFALVAAPLLLSRTAPAPPEGTELRVAAAAGALAAPPRRAVPTDRATRSSATGRVAADAVLDAETASPSTTPAPAATAPPATTAVPATTPPTTRPKPVTTTTAPPAPPPPPTTAPPPTSSAPAPAAVHSETGEASWYRGPDGECAHNRAPLGSTIRVTNLDTGASTTCRVAGRGPYGAGRVVDLTLSTFARVADPDAGVFHARVEW